MVTSSGQSQVQGEIHRGSSHFSSSNSLTTLKFSRIKVIFRDSKGDDIKTIEANDGDDLLSLAHEYDVELEGVSHFYSQVDWT